MKTTIRLTSPDKLDELIAYLESEKGLRWKTKQPDYKRQMLATIKTLMKQKTILSEINMKEKSCSVTFRTIDDIKTDADFLEAQGA